MHCGLSRLKSILRSNLKKLSKHYHSDRSAYTSPYKLSHDLDDKNICFHFIGYGNAVPKTVAGRMFLIIYATIGIPLMAMMLTTFGNKLQHAIRTFIIYFERKILKKNLPQNIQRKSLIAVFILTVAFLCSISAISATVENWEFSVALYVWFVTFTTIGFGDFIPGNRPLYGVFEIVFGLISLFLGLVLIATILHAVSDWVTIEKLPTEDDCKKTLNMSSSHSIKKDEYLTNMTEQDIGNNNNIELGNNIKSNELNKI